jgi:hypothetical protein
MQVEVSKWGVANISLGPAKKKEKFIYTGQSINLLKIWYEI